MHSQSTEPLCTAFPCVFICAHLSRDGARLSCRWKSDGHFALKNTASAKSRHSHFHYHLSTHPSVQPEDLEPSLSLFFLPIYAESLLLLKWLISCYPTSQLVIVSGFMCMYVHASTIQHIDATSKCMHPRGYTCSLYLCADGDRLQSPGWDGYACPQRQSCLAGVQTARTSNTAAHSHLSPVEQLQTAASHLGDAAHLNADLCIEASQEQKYTT